jgi:hypothetical protein
MAYIELCPTEISGLGELTKISQNVWKVEQVFLLEQEVTNNNTEFDKAARAKFYSALAKENEARVLDGQPKRCIGLQWHSHVWGGAHFASGGDAEAIDSCTAAWRFWMVLNKQGEYSARLDTYGDVRTVLPVSVKIIQPAISDEAKVACQAQIDELVKPAPALMFPTIPLGFKGGDYGEGFGFRTLEDLDFI